MRKKKKHKILLHGWLSATRDLLFHACLLALSHSGRHGRTTTTVYVPAAAVIMVSLYVLRLVVLLKYKKSVAGKEKLERSSK